MIKKIEEIINSINGNILSLYFNESLFEKMNIKNKNIKGFITIEEPGKNSSFKKIKTHKLRKKIGKKKNDYLFYNIDNDKNLVKISDIIYISKNIYLCGNKEAALKKLKKFKRYKINYKIIEVKNDLIIKVDLSLARNNYFKDKLFYMIDILEKLYNLITDLLTA